MTSESVKVQMGDGIETLSEIELYLGKQQRLDAIETLKHFKTIIELLKINPLESNIDIYQGKNIHQLV